MSSVPATSPVVWPRCVLSLSSAGVRSECRLLGVGVLGVDLG